MKNKVVWIGAICVIAVLAVLFIGRSGGGREANADANDLVAANILTQNTSGNEQLGTTRNANAAQGEDSVPMIERLRVFGRVVTVGSENPVPNADIEIHANALDGYKQPAVRTKTDGAGYYEFLLERGEIPNGKTEILALADGYGAQRADLYTTRPNLREPIERNFQLAVGTSISGVVYDLEDNRIEGALVGPLIANARPDHRAENPYRAFPVVESETDGSFDLAGLSGEEPVRLYVQKRGFMPLYTPGIAPGTRNVELRLTPGEASVEGFVQDAAGKGIAGIPVRAMFRPQGRGFRPPRREFPDMEVQFTRTDESGFYEFSALNSGWQTIVADTDQPLTQSIGESMLFEKDDHKTLNLRFKPLLVVNGIFVDDQTEQPVQGVHVAKPGPNQPSGSALVPAAQEVITGADGRFTVETAQVEMNGVYTVPELAYRLPHSYGIDAEDWQFERLSLERLEEGREVRIEIERSVLLEGIVVQSDGETPIAGAGVDFVRIQRGQMPRMPAENFADAASVTDGNGRFRLKVSPGANGAAFARHAGGNTYEMVNVPAEGAPPEVKLVMKDFVSVSGIVTDPDGAPVTGAEITFFQLTNRNSFFGDERTITDENGRYLKEGLAAEMVRVQPRPIEGSDLIPPDVMSLNLVPNENRTDVNFQYRKGSRFEGVVVNQDDAPVAGATVSLQQWGGGRGGPGGGGPGGGRGGPMFMPGAGTSALSDAEGKFSLVLAPESEDFRLQATHPSYDDKIVAELFLDDSPITIKMDGRTRISLTAWKADGAQLTNFEYQFVIERESNARERRASVGTTVFSQTEPVVESLSPGSYRAHIYEVSDNRQRTGLYGFENFEVPVGGEPVEVKVTMGSALTLRGVVLGPDDAPIDDAEVTLTQRDEPNLGGGGQWGGRGGGGNGAAEREVDTGADGTFAFDYVSPGAVTIRARKNGFVQEGEVSLTIAESGEPELVTVRMLSGAGIYGVVLSNDGSPMRNVRVHLEPRRGQGERPNDEGGYEYNNLPPGRQTVILVSETGSEIERKTATVTSAERTEVNFDLSGLIAVEGNVTRNGQPDRSRWLQLELNPAEGGGKRLSVVSNNGRFSAYMTPGEYEILVNGNKSGETLTVAETPASQSLDVDLKLFSIGIVIVAEEEGFSGGTMNFRHRLEGEEATSREVEVRRALFYLENEPAGQVRGRFTDGNGVRYSSTWTNIGNGQENILTLIPDTAL